MLLFQWLSIYSMLLLVIRSAVHYHSNNHNHHRTIWNRQITNIPTHRYYSVTSFQWHTTATTAFHRRPKHVPTYSALPVALKLQNQLLYRSLNHEPIRGMMSVSGVIYDVENNNDKDDTDEHGQHESRGMIVVTLFTKEGCTLCDKAKDVLQSLRSKYPHKLVAVDITDPLYRERWYEKYKYDIPVLHVTTDDNNNNNIYWAKHRITIEQAEQCFQEIQSGTPITSIGTEPNAANSRPKGSNNSNSNANNS